MALQMEDALSGNVAEFGGFDGMESVLTCTKPVEHVVAGCVSRVDGSALIPISAIGINRIDHGRLLCSSTTSPTFIVYQVKEHDLRCDARSWHDPAHRLGAPDCRQWGRYRNPRKIGSCKKAKKPARHARSIGSMSSSSPIRAECCNASTLQTHRIWRVKHQPAAVSPPTASAIVLCWWKLSSLQLGAEPAR